MVHRLLLLGNLLIHLFLLVRGSIHTSLLKCEDGILVVLGGDQFFSLLEMLLVLLTLFFLLFGLLCLGILYRLAVGRGLVCLLFKLHHIGDKSRSLAYRLHDVLQELCIHLFGSTCECQRNDVVCRLIFQPISLRQCRYCQLSVRFADDERQVYALGHHL